MDRKSWLAALSRSDKLAWDQFFADYSRLVYSVLNRFSLDEEEKQDLFQGVCVVVLETASSIRDADRFSSWLFSVSHQMASDLLRRSARRRRREERGDSFGGRATAPDQALLEFEAIALTRDAYERLGERCRALLGALYLEEPRPRYAEISKRLGMPVGSIGPTRARCLGQLRSHWDEVSGEPGVTTTGSDAPESAEAGVRHRRDGHE